jgi:hypothetical protein
LKLQQFGLQFPSKELSSENITLKKFNKAVQPFKDFFNIAKFDNSKPGCTKVRFILFVFMFMMKSSAATGSRTLASLSMDQGFESSRRSFAASTLSIMTPYTKCRFDNCRYGECRGAAL